MKRVGRKCPDCRQFAVVVGQSPDGAYYWKCPGGHITRTVEERTLSELSFEDHPDPVARRDDPETSWEAAASVEELSDRRKAVYSLLRQLGPSTDEEIAERYPRDAIPQSPSGLRTRRSELVEMGLVEFAHEYKTLKSGRRARVWRLTEEASR